MSAPTTRRALMRAGAALPALALLPVAAAAADTVQDHPDAALAIIRDTNDAGTRFAHAATDAEASAALAEISELLPAYRAACAAVGIFSGGTAPMTRPFLRPGAQGAAKPQAPPPPEWWQIGPPAVPRPPA